jgi:osmotically inducible lipoprotein OsmB
MRTLLMIGAACAVLAASSAAAEEQLWTGVAICAGTSAIVAGPPGALVGGVIGGVVGGPRLFGRRYRECWYDRAGYRHAVGANVAG